MTSELFRLRSRGQVTRSVAQTTMKPSSVPENMILLPRIERDESHLRAQARYMPSVFFFRRSLRASATHEQAVAIGLTVCTELEHLKAWVRERGMIPPKWMTDNGEAAEKGWGVGA
jgi:hypothetical protein